jgi:hypothetical protein
VVPWRHSSSTAAEKGLGEVKRMGDQFRSYYRRNLGKKKMRAQVRKEIKRSKWIPERQDKWN